MRRLIISGRFHRKLNSFIKKHPHLRKKLEQIFHKLLADSFAPNLQTHKLSGKLKMFYGCSVDYDYRLVFGLDNDNVYLLNLGTHDEVY